MVAETPLENAIRRAAEGNRDLPLDRLVLLLVRTLEDGAGPEQWEDADQLVLVLEAAPVEGVDPENRRPLQELRQYAIDHPRAAGIVRALVDALSPEETRLAELIEGGTVEDTDHRLWQMNRVDLRELYPSGLHQTLMQSYPESTLVHLLRRTPDINTPDGYHRNWLHHSLRYRRPFVTRWLLRQPALVDQADRDGWTPLHMAVRAGDEPAALYLIGQTPDLDRRLSDGRTPLHLALQYARRQCLRELLRQGADPQATDGSGWCAWYYAVRYGNRDGLQQLWKRGLPPRENALLALAERHLDPEDYLRLRAGTGIAV